MTFERLMWISSQFENALQNLLELDKNFGEEIANLNDDDFTPEEIEAIERKNEDLDKLLYVLRKYC